MDRGGTGSALPLHPDHLADLRERSGLGDETIRAAGIRSLAPAEWPRRLSQRIVPKVQSCYLIPYPDADGFYRVKLFPPVPGKDGHSIRYYQPAGTAPRLYLPPHARAALADPSVTLLITEGEKKALKADQEGLACAALGGLWSWLLDGQPFPDLDRVDWCEREVLLVPDSDAWVRADLLQAIYALGKEIEGRGARMAVLKLPANSGQSKVGLDDYLLVHSVDEFSRLPRLPLKHPVFNRTADWWRGWCNKKADEATPRSEALALLAQGETVRYLHPAQDVANGVLFYGAPVGGALVVVTSKREGCRADQLHSGFALRHADPGPSAISREAFLGWLGGESRGSVAQVLDELQQFFTRYVVFRDERDPLLLAAWTVGTYCYRAVRIFPYLALRSAEKRCGKTRLLTLLGKLAFNASPVTTFPTEAQLYRSAARTGGAQLFDEVETLKGDKERFEALIAVLNVGFEKGGVVSRLEKRGEKFLEVHYEVYAPRVLAGLGALKDTLEDRSIPLFLLRKRRDEPVARLTQAVEAEAQGLRDQCALACLNHIGDILTAYEAAPPVLEKEAIDDRAVDLWLPLVAMTLVADAETEDEGDRTLRLLGLARELAGVRDADQEAGTTSRLLDALEAIREGTGEVLTPTELLHALKAQPGWEWLKSTKRLATLLHPLGLFAGSKKTTGKVVRAYELALDKLADLRARYAPSALGMESGE